MAQNPARATSKRLFVLKDTNDQPVLLLDDDGEEMESLTCT